MSKIVVEFDTEKLNLRKMPIHEVLRLDHAIKSGDFETFAQLEAFGVKLVSAEDHTPQRQVEHIGYTDCVNHTDIANYNSLDDLDYEPGVVLPVMAVYRGPVQYLVAVPVGDGDGGYPYELELKATREEADTFNREIYEKF